MSEDLDRGRVYLPQEDLRRYDADPSRRQVTPEWTALMRFEIGRCRRLYVSADIGIGMLPPQSARCVRTARVLYSRILDVIEEQGYDVFTQRARVPTWQKAALVARHLRRDVVRRRVVEQAAFAAAGAAMVITPLLPRGRRALAASVVVGGLAATTGVAAAAALGNRACARCIRNGCYCNNADREDRHDDRAPVRALPLRRCAAAHGGRSTRCWSPWPGSPWRCRPVKSRTPRSGQRSTAPARIVAGGAALAAWDLFLDPQMVGEGYWEWGRKGRYRGIPLSNQAGWLLTGAALMAALERLVPPAPGDADRALVGVYGWMAVMETLGFALVLPGPRGGRGRRRGHAPARRAGGAAGLGPWLRSSSSGEGWAVWPPPSACGPPATA